MSKYAITNTTDDGFFQTLIVDDINEALKWAQAIVDEGLEVLSIVIDEED